MPAQKEILDYNKEVMQDPPLEVDTDSPFIIVNGRIVENPYYKFKKGAKKRAFRRKRIDRYRPVRYAEQTSEQYRKTQFFSAAKKQ